LDDTALRLGCGTMIKLLAEYNNHMKQWNIKQNESHVQKLVIWIGKNKPQINNLAQALNQTLKAALRMVE